MPICADCGESIPFNGPMYVTTGPAGIGKYHHSGCGDPFGTKAAIASAISAERERCAEMVEQFGIVGAKRRHPRTNAMFKRLAEAIRKGT